MKQLVVLSPQRQGVHRQDDRHGGAGSSGLPGDVHRPGHANVDAANLELVLDSAKREEWCRTGQ